jgi:hypothetical protein
MTKKDQFIEETVRKLLAERYKEVDEPLKAELIQFSTETDSMSFDVRFGNVTVEFPMTNLITHIVDEMNARLVRLPLKFKDGKIDIIFEEAEGLKAGLDWFTTVAAVYFFLNLQPKAAAALNLLFDESLAISLMAGQAGFAKKMGDTGIGPPADINVREALNGLKKQEAAADRHRVAHTLLGTFERLGLKFPCGKGRPRTWTQKSLRQAVEKASLQVRKKKYREPRLTDVANSLNKSYPDRMPLNAKSLGQMLKRHDIDWKELKNPHN